MHTHAHTQLSSIGRLKYLILQSVNMNILLFFFSPADNNEFHKHQRAKRELNLNCRCLDVRNITVSPHLLTEPCSYVVENEGGWVKGETKMEDGMVKKLTADPDPSHRVESPKQLHTNPCWKRFNKPDSSCAQTHCPTPSDDPPHQKISHVAQSQKGLQQSAQTNIKQQRLRRKLLPLTRSHESPASSGVARVEEQSTEDQDEDLAVPWRCKAMVNPESSQIPTRTLPILQNTDRAPGCEILKLCQRISSRVNSLKCTTSAKRAGLRPAGWRLLQQPIGDNGAQIRVGRPKHHPGKDSHSQSLTSLLHNNDRSCGSSLTQTCNSDTCLYGWDKYSSRTLQQHVQKDQGSRREKEGVRIQIQREESWDSESQEENRWQSESYKTTCRDVTLLDIVRLLQCRLT
ncbi:uncharacterized protein LOC109614847 isoform X2 [Esox lucius]|uniref:uncharacterized protein LOC109614847 isoform X2 n=1 Tax=Esox lucius TaxID=8010 RepID=UPI0009733FEE|nr:uncharacterized protein LOC109614847 isoform X2 [Esox lucius]